MKTLLCLSVCLCARMQALGVKIITAQRIIWIIDIEMISIEERLRQLCVSYIYLLLTIAKILKKRLSSSYEKRIKKLKKST